MTEHEGRVEDPRDTTSVGDRPRIAFNYDLLSGIALILIGAFAWVRSPGWEERAWAFPNLISWLMIALGLYLCIVGLRRRTRERLFRSARAAVDALWFSASVLLFFYMIRRLGYFVATWIFISLQALILGGRHQRWLLRIGIVLLGGAIAFGLDLMFSEGFNVRLPEGSWFSD